MTHMQAPSSSTVEINHLIDQLNEATETKEADQPLSAQWLTTLLGAMLAVADDQALRLLAFDDWQTLPKGLKKLSQTSGRNIAFQANPLFETLQQQLNGYFNGQLAQFTVPIHQNGSDFYQKIWHLLGQIPVGQAHSYGDLAKHFGQSGYAQAVGRACGANMVALIVPCHRVVGAKGALTGYAGHLWRKQWLLDHERQFNT